MSQKTILHQITRQNFLLLVDLKEDTRWKDWAAWSRCGYPCTSGSQTRSRQCEPYSKPKYGGTNYCVGSDTDSRDCASNTIPSNEKSKARFYLCREFYFIQNFHELFCTS